MKKQTPIFQPLVLALILATGFASVWGLFALWIVEETRDTRSGGSLRFLADGTPVIHDGQTVRDLDGKDVPGAEQGPWLAGFSLPVAGPEPLMLGRAPWQLRLRPFADNRQVNWFFVADGNTPGFGHFVGFDRETAMRMGFLGTAGFRAETLPQEEYFPLSSAESFPFMGRMALHSHLCSRQNSFVPYGRVFSSGPAPDPADLFVFVWADDGKIYRVDLGQRTVAVVFAEPGLRSLNMEMWSGKTTPGKFPLAARTDDAVALVDGADGSVRRFPIPVELRQRGNFFWAEQPGGSSLACVVRGNGLRSPTEEYQIFWIDGSGQITRRVETTVRRPDMRTLRTAMGGIAPAPILSGMLVAIQARSLLYHEEAATYPDGLTQALADFWPSLALAGLVSMGLAWACNRRQTRYATSGLERTLWPLFVFLFGLPGWVAYRYGRSWPVLDRCPSCRKLVPCVCNRCAACQVEFPQPALKGTEVFA